jgi:peroxiredoxin
MRDAQLANINPTVRDVLDANKNLGQFLASLLVSGGDGNIRDHRGTTIELAYTSFDIQPSGILLHGLLTVPQWRPAHVEFEEIPANSGPGRGVIGASGTVLWEGTDYSALKTWIPGGSVRQYEWAHAGQAQPYIDANRFVLLHPPPQSIATAFSTGAVSSFVPPGADSSGIVSAFNPLCLTVRGLRVPSYGPGPMQPVSATICGYSSFPVLNGSIAENPGELPLIAVTHPGPDGLVRVVGHAEAPVDRAGSGMPQLVVSFPDDKMAGGLEFLTRALRNSERPDAAKGAIVVLSPEQLSRAPHVRGVIYGENHGGAWERVYGVKKARRPLTLIVGPSGKVVWQHEGELDAVKLAAALRQHLTTGGAARVNIPRLGLRAGAPLPADIVFEYSPGRQVTLSKLKRPATLIFCMNTSKTSIDAVRDFEKATQGSPGLGSVVLAIIDETPEMAKKAAAENGLSAILVPDPNREIARAYGVTMRPTIVSIDASGLVWQVRYGRVAT